MTPSQIQAILDALDEQNTARTALASQVEAVGKSLGDFQAKYDYDMRGDGKINGYKGLIVEFQFVKDEILKHPSIAGYIAKEPIKAVLAGMGAFVAGVTLWFGLHILASIPAVDAWFQRWLGL